MAWGFDADVMSTDTYSGARAAVYNSVAKIVAAGADYKDAYLTLQEFFERLRNEPARWGKPFAALLGAMDAQLELSVAAIGGKDSMSGTFLDKDVPPTLISFAIAPIKADKVISPEFKAAGHPVYIFAPDSDDAESTKKAWECFHEHCERGSVKAAWAVENGIAEAVMKMSLGNEIGFKAEPGVVKDSWYNTMMFDFIVAELDCETDCKLAVKIGMTTEEPVIDLDGDSATVEELAALNSATLEDVYPTVAKANADAVLALSYRADGVVSPRVKVEKPRVLIPVFPGTNCEYDSARAVEKAGLEADVVVIRNLTSEDVARSIKTVAKKIRESHIIFIPGGFSGGDEPDGSAKFITAFFRNPEIKEEVRKLLDERDGLMLGICNGFQALIKLGLVPYGRIIDTDESCPTLAHNIIGRHQSKLVRTRVCTNKSPWLQGVDVDEIYTVPISHGEGRFLCDEAMALKLAQNGQIATQYVDESGTPSMDTAFNPNGSVLAIEGITSPDGRILGKMGHSERIGNGLYKNVVGEYDMKLFESAAKYFKQ
jgi:phosphoribosylformylglycinamidine synthase